MKPSHELRRHTYATLIDWRTDCSRMGVLHFVNVKEHLSKTVAEISVIRLSHAYAPIFTCLERVDTILKSLKYVIVLALLLSGSQAEARYRHVHHHSSVDRTVRVYDPPRLEARDTAEPVVSVFDTGYYELRYPNLDISRELYVTPPHAIDITPPPVVESSPIPDYVPVYAKMLIALGMMVLLTPLAHRVTGRWDVRTSSTGYMTQREIDAVTSRIGPMTKVTLVETRRYLPLWVSSAYLLVKHKLRLR